MTEYFKYLDAAGTHFYRITDGSERADSLYAGESITPRNLSAEYVRGHKNSVAASEVPEHFRVNEPLASIVNAKFQRGDKITGEAYFGDETLTGVVTHLGRTGSGTPVYWVDTDTERGRFIVASTAALVEPPAPGFAFVGPEPAKAPTVTTPFELGRYEGDNRRVWDSRGRLVAEFTGQDTTSEQDAELAALVVRLLNEHFGAK